jgi:hypothetical protein
MIPLPAPRPVRGKRHRYVSNCGPTRDVATDVVDPALSAAENEGWPIVARATPTRVTASNVVRSGSRPDR